MLNSGYFEVSFMLKLDGMQLFIFDKKLILDGEKLEIK